MIPFVALLALIMMNIARVVMWMRRAGTPFSPSVPLAAFITGALVHAAFEDWMFAVGYYACVFFWSMVFVLPDLLPAAVATRTSSLPVHTSFAWKNDLNVAPTIR